MPNVLVSGTARTWVLASELVTVIVIFYGAIIADVLFAIAV